MYSKNIILNKNKLITCPAIYLPIFVLVLSSILLILSGCAGRYVVPEAQGKKFINSATVSCKKPYVLTQDCSSMWGAKRVLNINNNKVKVAASADGKVILVMDKSPILSSAKAGLAWPVYDSYSKGNSDNFNVIKYALLNHKIEMLDVKPMGFLGHLDGYFLILNQDGYSVLKQYTEEKPTTKNKKENES